MKFSPGLFCLRPRLISPSAARAVTPAVVNIQTMSEAGDFWHKGVVSTSTGSGVIISKDGYIVTNSHVVEGSSEIEVTLNDNRKFEAEVIGVDASTDLALLHIDGKKLPFCLLEIQILCRWGSG